MVVLCFSSFANTDGKVTKVIERIEEGKEPLIEAPETVILGPNDSIYVMTEKAELVAMTDFQPVAAAADYDDKEAKDNTESKECPAGRFLSAKTTRVADLGIGRPLGGQFTYDGKTLYIADMVLGLTRIHDPHLYPTSKVELVASSVYDEERGGMSQILFADDVVIGPKTGMVYFTDGTCSNFSCHPGIK